MQLNKGNVSVHGQVHLRARSEAFPTTRIYPRIRSNPFLPFPSLLFLFPKWYHYNLLMYRRILILCTHVFAIYIRIYIR